MSQVSSKSNQIDRQAYQTMLRALSWMLESSSLLKLLVHTFHKSNFIWDLWTSTQTNNG